ncbi:hypothetical protein [Oceanihabitans sediminis]|uniref:Uncharacterized protein n=1 Tax=Oceanihabitans sediminis TaxID=1812012 RepID=A0A368P1P4_9FLAO|nr:hypothetical protein [Oceanihabitans sediminis]MDX1277384.1 hypothetical protein [Oceanihabitans sediminis]MDX1774150.1 hypothetical protein [Oceanihabitans sediminis]RBP30810.1 hypothetical protein DFR65_10468 [Oceanihabitans sediminis]RCU56777.1 hypothetical protein DU428_10500 [Oceanihabitans sediminis]
MKTFSIKLLLVILIINLSSCKQENTPTFSNYKFAEKPQVLSCTDVDSKLLNEALYSFESDIAASYNNHRNNLVLSINTFTRQAASRTPDYAKIATQHSVELASALKDAGFLNDNGVNYNNPVFDCFTEKIQESGLKTTFNALLSTNSLKKELINPPLQRNAHTVGNDKYLAMYVALEYYYSAILNMDLEAENKPAENTKVDFNKRPARK